MVASVLSVVDSVAQLGIQCVTLAAGCLNFPAGPKLVHNE